MKDHGAQLGRDFHNDREDALRDTIAKLRADRAKLREALEILTRWATELTEATDGHALDMLVSEHKRDTRLSLARRVLAKTED